LKRINNLVSSQSEVPPMDKKVTVLITSFNDTRIRNTLESIRGQTMTPDEILVADGGTKWDISKVCSEFDARLEIIPGNVVETRSKAINIANGDIVAFIDTDEVAPAEWLQKLTEPVFSGVADFTGGPTRHKPPKSGPEDYMNKLEDMIYENLVPENIAYLPMGNSAWRKSIFQAIGGFDLNIYGGSEDYDINIRALKSGFRGKYVPEAYLYHDHSDISSYRALIKKRYSYLRATAKTYIKNRQLANRVTSSKGRRVDHPFYIIEALMKPVALIDAFLRN